MAAPQVPTLLLLDSGDPADSRNARALLGRLDGQTTNPSLIAQNPDIRKRVAAGERLSQAEAVEFYRRTVLAVAEATDGPISVEVYADEASAPEDLCRQGREMVRWIPNAYVKLPLTSAGLTAAERLTAEGVPLNMTLCFTQEQAAAVYSATQGAAKPAFVSPFVGRFDDRGECGMDLVVNILSTYAKGDGHVHTLTASVRTLDHLLYTLALRSPLVTAPLKVYQAWAQAGFQVPDSSYRYPRGTLTPIPFHEVPLGRPWREYDIRHDLTDVGLRKFAEAWNSLLRA
jgi:transaldolase